MCTTEKETVLSQHSSVNDHFLEKKMTRQVQRCPSTSTLCSGTTLDAESPTGSTSTCATVREQRHFIMLPFALDLILSEVSSKRGRMSMLDWVCASPSN